jgi:hypothetical protein
MSNKLMVHHYVKQHPKHSSRDYQRAYFNSAKTLTDAQRDALATAAYEASLKN